MNTPKEIANNYIAIGKGKVNMPVAKMFVLGILAGMFIAVGGIASATAGAALPGAAGKIVGACLFPGGLTMVLLAGSELFTGNCLLVIPLLKKEITIAGMLKNWIIVYLGNFVGTKKGDCGDLYTVNEVPHGNVSKVWYDSPTLKMQRRMTVYTPAGYDKGKDYPVLYLLHGAGGDEDAWTTLGRAQHILDNLIATGKAKPMVVVMTNGNPNCQAAPGEWSAGQYIPSFYGYQGAKPAATMDESFPDVMNYVESHYKVAKDKAHRAICGLSMGGGHSFDISRRFPTKFDYIGLFSAGLHVGTTGDFRSDFYKQLQGNEEAKKQLATLFKNKPKLYWIGMGKTDFLYKSSADLRRYFDEKGYKYTYLETEGGHIWRNWRVYLTEFAQKIFK